MVSEQSAKKVIATLKKAGWVPLRTVGSHTIWQSPSGATFSLPDGHKNISPGVYRKLRQAMEGDK